MDVLGGATIIPYWENKSWEENEGCAPLKPSYVRRYFNFIFEQRKVHMEREDPMRMSIVYSNPSPFDRITPPRRRMSLDYRNIF